MLIVLLLKLCICELPLLVVKICTSLGVNPGVIVTDHGVFIVQCSAVLLAFGISTTVMIAAGEQ